MRVPAGSANQLILGLTERGRQLAEGLERWPNRLQVVVDESGLWWAGIPPRGFRSAFTQELLLEGIQVTEEVS